MQGRGLGLGSCCKGRTCRLVQAPRCWPPRAALLQGGALSPAARRSRGVCVMREQARSRWCAATGP